MSYIELHRTKGLNPHLSVCSVCGGPARDVILIGRREVKTTCPECDTINYGSFSYEKCGNCGSSLRGGASSRIEDNEKIPSICEECEAKQKKQIDEMRAMVSAGGIYWVCAVNKRHKGIYTADSPLAIWVREKMGIAPPKPCGIQHSSKDCPICSPLKEQSNEPAAV